MGKARMWLATGTLLLLLAASAASTIHFDEKDLASEESMWDLYERWRSHHTVSRDLAEKDRRFEVFKANARAIHDFNTKEDAPYKLALNRFADMSQEEFRRHYAGSRIAHHRQRLGATKQDTAFGYANVSRVPASVDWREKGAVTPVKDQGQCGSCWAFSTVVSVEGINQIKTKELVPLSEQQLVDCDKDENQGCNGGLMDYAFEYIKTTGGLATEEDYPYMAEESSCGLTKKKGSTVVTIDGFEDVPANNEDALLKAVANQPVSVAIEAGGMEFQFYSEGVFTGRCGTELDHGVAVVGYGTTRDGTKYWIVRNSWGPEWGEKGYIRMQRGIKAKHGLCGIAMQASYPIKTSPNPKITVDEETASDKDEL